MKTALFLLLLAGLHIRVAAQQASGPPVTQPVASATNGVTSDEALLRRLAQEWRAIYNGTDAGKFATLYAAEAEYISGHVEGLVAKGRERVIANFQRGMNMGGHLDLVEVLSVNISCDLATLVCRDQATNSGQTVAGRNLLVVKRINGQWLIVTHVTVV